jgi:hypothetical protein
MVTEISQIRWRAPGDKTDEKFAPGDKVRISRLADAMTSPGIIGHTGTLLLFDDDLPREQAEVACATCGGTHLMHRSELDLMESDEVSLAVDKAGIEFPDNDAQTRLVEEHAFENRIVLALHMSGLGFVSVADCPYPLRDPALPAPRWIKYGYAWIKGMCELGRVYDSIGAALVPVGAVVSEMTTGRHYENVVTVGDRDVMAFDLPIRITIQSTENKARSATVHETDYKRLALSLKNGFEIDIGAIQRVLKSIGLRIENYIIEGGVSINVEPVSVMQSTAERQRLIIALVKVMNDWEWNGDWFISVRNNTLAEYDFYRITKIPGKSAKWKTIDYSVPF